ncbi:MarR family winged helix-turn-helix transcriptional regulator [Nocardia sp. NPDC088792]|uniref:MarR family winged helix-turn-helix transcriptional regulator n=1 Tax=Nocardia sp. NPDC088792 TaxID=3364332 RepID=UPI00380C9896
MTAKGWVERVPHTADRRAIRVHLTDSGRSLIDRILPLHTANEQRLLAGFSPADREALVPLLRKFSESLGDPPDEMFSSQTVRLPVPHKEFRK